MVYSLRGAGVIAGHRYISSTQPQPNTQNRAVAYGNRTNREQSLLPLLLPQRRDAARQCGLRTNADHPDLGPKVARGLHFGAKQKGINAGGDQQQPL